MPIIFYMSLYFLLDYVFHSILTSCFSRCHLSLVTVNSDLHNHCPSATAASMMHLFCWVLSTRMASFNRIHTTLLYRLKFTTTHSGFVLARTVVPTAAPEPSLFLLLFKIWFANKRRVIAQKGGLQIVFRKHACFTFVAVRFFPVSGSTTKVLIRSTRLFHLPTSCDVVKDNAKHDSDHTNRTPYVDGVAKIPNGNHNQQTSFQCICNTLTHG